LAFWVLTFFCNSYISFRKPEMSPKSWAGEAISPEICSTSFAEIAGSNLRPLPGVGYAQGGEGLVQGEGAT
jgi:hypothetical protein